MKGSERPTELNMASAIINQIITLQSPEGQRALLRDLFERYGWPEREEYRILSDIDVAERFGVYIRTVQDWLISGQLRGFKEARKWFTRTDWLREFENVRAEDPKLKPRTPKRRGPV